MSRRPRFPLGSQTPHSNRGCTPAVSEAFTRRSGDHAWHGGGFVGMTPHSAKESSRCMLMARNHDLDAPEIIDGPILKGPDAVAVEHRRMMSEIGVE